MNPGASELFDPAAGGRATSIRTRAAADRASAPADNVALARLYGEPLFRLPDDLYIPPDALEIFLEAFEGPLDLLLYLIRKQHFNVLDIPMAPLTLQYLTYIDQIRDNNLELAAEYLLMAALLIEIKSRMLLPTRKADSGKRSKTRAPNLSANCSSTSGSSWRRSGWTNCHALDATFLTRCSGDRTVARKALSRCRRGRLARCVGRCRQAREAHGTASYQPRGVFGSRAHEPDPEDAAGKRSSSSSVICLIPGEAPRSRSCIFSRCWNLRAKH